MRLEYSRDHFDDTSAIFGRALCRSIVLDAVNQVIDRSNMSSFVGAVCAWFGLPYARRGDQLPSLTRPSGRPTAVSQDVCFRKITALHFDDALRTKHLNREPPGTASHASARCEVAISTAAK